MDEQKELKSLGDMFFHCLAANGNKIFQYVDDTNEKTTHSEILIRSIRTAIKLQKKGIKRNDIISSCSHNHVNSRLPFIATQLLGAICSTFDPNLPHIDTVYLLKLIQPKILFVSEEALEFMEKCLKEANIDTELVVFGHNDKYCQFSEYLEPSEDEKHFKPVTVTNDSDTAAIMFSSGTTGMPKGIMLSHKALIRVTDESSYYEKAKHNPTVFLAYSTLYWISALFVLIKTVLRGYSLILCYRFDPGNTWRLFDKYKVTHTFLPPYLLVDIIKKLPKDADCSSVEEFILGGSHSSLKLIDDIKRIMPNAKVINGYAQTECAGVITIFDGCNPEDYALQLEKPQSCGKIRKGLKWKVVDIETGDILGPNKQGELLVKQEGYLLTGYYKANSSPYEPDGYLRTGDVMYYDKDECFYFVGRHKEMFKYKGWHVVPAILEEILLSHPAVKEAVVIGVPHEEDGDHPLAVVVLFDEYKNINTNEILSFVNNKVSDTQQLRAGIQVIDTIPKSATGKLQRTLLKNQILKNV